MLTRDEIKFILERLADVVVIEPTKDFPFRVSRRGHGYSDDEKVGKLQAKLSMMLEMVSR